MRRPIPRITIEYASGERKTFAVPRWVAFHVADALCESTRFGVEVEWSNGKRWALKHRLDLNPRWTRIPTDGVEHTRHSVESEVTA